MESENFTGHPGIRSPRKIREARAAIVERLIAFYFIFDGKSIDYRACRDSDGC